MSTVAESIIREAEEIAAAAAKPSFWALSVAELSDIADRLGVPLPTLVRVLRTRC